MSLLKSAATVGGLTLVSRLLGFLRDQLIAFTLGTGPVAEAFFVAQRFPNLFRALFAEGAFNSAFVPQFARRIEGEGQSAAHKFATEIFSALLAWLLVFTALSMIAMPWLIYVIAPGFSQEAQKLQLTIDLTRICFPYLLFMSLTALQSGVLNSLNRFTAAAAAPILLNIVMIALKRPCLGVRHRQQCGDGLYLCLGCFTGGGCAIPASGNCLPARRNAAFSHVADIFS